MDEKTRMLWEKREGRAEKSKGKKTEDEKKSSNASTL